jgi:hypothetical protein
VTIAVTPVLFVLVAFDLLDAGVRHWFTAHAFTADALVGVLVLLITVLNVDRVVRRRSVREREQVTAAQALIVGRQGQRATGLVRATLGDRTQRDAAADELRTYMGMLLVSAPILIDAPPARAFLEEAQRLGGLLSYALAHAEDRQDLGPRLDAAAQRVLDSARPLLSVLDRAQLRAVGDDAAGDGAPEAATGVARTGPPPDRAPAGETE